MNRINVREPEGIEDGDEAFYRVNTFLPSHRLEPGTAADAVNKRFEDGRAWPRFGIGLEGWGKTEINFVPANAIYSPTVTVPNMVLGETYLITNNDAQMVLVMNGAARLYVDPGTTSEFIANSTSLTLSGGADLVDTPCRCVINRKQVIAPLGYQRFNDPDGFDSTVLLTDEWRVNTNDDGGRGRAWRLVAGNEPVEVPLNGHDLWDTARIVPCYNGLVLLRTGNERHYFTGSLELLISDTSAAADTLTLTLTANLVTGRPVTVTGITGASGTYYVRVVDATKVSLYDTSAHAIAGGGTGLFNVSANGEGGLLTRLAVDPATHRILLNAAPNFVDGDRVLIHFEANAIFDGTTTPNADSRYFVKVLNDTDIELYTDDTLATKLLFTSCEGGFYIERQADNPGFYGNGAPALLAQPNALGNTLWDGGFDAADTSVLITATSATTDIVTCPNHRLLDGDLVQTTGITISGGPATGQGYVRVVNENMIQLHTSQTGALAGSASTLMGLTDSQTGTIKRATASGLPLPPGREGCYFQNQLLIVNDRATLAVSDPLDPLHFQAFNGITANLGESDQINALVPFGADSVLVLKENTIEVLGNFSAGLTGWTLTALSREYGCLAPLSVAMVGNDVWFLSRKGVASITQTANGTLQGVAEPVSRPVQKYIDRINWNYAAQAVAAYWNNRYFLAVPLKGQTGTVRNNGLLVYNFLMQGWEGLWEGDTLLPFGLARLTVAGEERLTFCDYNGTVRQFTEGWTDDGEPIADRLVTRRYIGGNRSRKLWLAGEINWDTHKPSLTVLANAPGYGTEQTLAEAEYDPTQYLIYGQADYDPATSTAATFGAPHREDYSLTPEELLAGELDVHQNITEPLRMRVDDWGLQLTIENVTGSCRIGGVRVNAAQRDYMSVRK